MEKRNEIMLKKGSWVIYFMCWLDNIFVGLRERVKCCELIIDCFMLYLIKALSECVFVNSKLIEIIDIISWLQESCFEDNDTEWERITFRRIMHCELIRSKVLLYFRWQVLVIAWIPESLLQIRGLLGDWTWEEFNLSCRIQQNRRWLDVIVIDAKLTEVRQSGDHTENNMPQLAFFVEIYDFVACVDATLEVLL